MHVIASDVDLAEPLDVNLGYLLHDLLRRGPGDAEFLGDPRWSNRRGSHCPESRTAVAPIRSPARAGARIDAVVPARIGLEMRAEPPAPNTRSAQQPTEQHPPAQGPAGEGGCQATSRLAEVRRGEHPVQTRQLRGRAVRPLARLPRTPGLRAHATMLQARHCGRVHLDPWRERGARGRRRTRRDSSWLASMSPMRAPLRPDPGCPDRGRASRARRQDGRGARMSAGRCSCRQGRPRCPLGSRATGERRSRLRPRRDRAAAQVNLRGLRTTRRAGDHAGSPRGGTDTARPPRNLGSIDRAQTVPGLPDAVLHGPHSRPGHRESAHTPDASISAARNPARRSAVRVCSVSGTTPRSVRAMASLGRPRCCR